MKSDWLKIGPEAMYRAPRQVAKLWNVKSIYITENGASASDQPALDGTVYDLDRIIFLRGYLTQLQRATSEGAPVTGYFLWSLMDNFEWVDGYEKRLASTRSTSTPSAARQNFPPRSIVRLSNATWWPDRPRHLNRGRSAAIRFI
jgi:beta-glucosidase/6-phospho-beta-glucosidase/beta-galactosidase